MGREIDLNQYYPDVVSEIREFKGIAAAENPEVADLFQKLENCLSDNFIRDATYRGIKRYEKLLGIAPAKGATLEERKLAVLTRWNRQLPYTVRRLLEQLTVMVGKGGFLLVRGFEQYEIKLKVMDKTLLELHSIRDMVKDMLPANILLYFAGVYLISMDAKTKTESCLETVSEFYPRYNLQHLLLDESWNLDDTYLLNGYKSDVYQDFYPLVFGLILESNVPTIVASHEMGFLSMIGMDGEVGSDFGSGGNVEIGIGTRARQSFNNNFITVADASAGLTVEKALWYLDGTFMLDETKLLEADIIKYQL